MSSPLRFEITHRAGLARLGRVATLHGSFDTPAFMPVGTQGSIKGLLPHLVAQSGAQIVLANTYHLMLRPGAELIARMGGLQRWTSWQGPMLTDSGGFQVFSLSDINTISDEGVTFKSHLDGCTVQLTPARSMTVQNQLGADIIMAFDDCPPAEGGSRIEDRGSGSAHPSPVTRHPSRLLQAAERSARWLAQCVTAHLRHHEQALFGIVQGGTDLDLRRWSVDQTCSHDLPGYAIGGVAVGEGFAQLKRVVEFTAPLLPSEKPRYLMGVGYERDILAAVRAGVDMFDCVLPTRNGRNASAFTRAGGVRLRNACFADDPRPIEEGCDCPACAGFTPPNLNPQPPTPAAHFSRSYLRHLFMANEMLGPILVSLHNLRHFQRLMLDIRRAILDNDWSALHRAYPVLDRPD